MHCYKSMALTVGSSWSTLCEGVGTGELLKHYRQGMCTMSLTSNFSCIQFQMQLHFIEVTSMEAMSMMGGRGDSEV